MPVKQGLSYLSQMLVIIFMMFVSAASGYAACIAFIRGLAGRTSDQVGNFYMRSGAYYHPGVAALLHPRQGCCWYGRAFPRISPEISWWTQWRAHARIIATGPVAALESIKHLGTNGGGFLGANSSTPIENPTILTNLIELWSMMLLPGACVVTFGRMVHDRRTEARHRQAQFPSRCARA